MTLELSTITPLYAGFFGLLHVYLSWRVVTLRNKYKNRMGEEGHTELTAITRAHDDLLEYLVMALFLMLLLECQEFSFKVIHTQGLLLVAARLIHLKGMRDPSGASFRRRIGTRLTWLQIAISSVLCITGAFGLVF